MHTENVGLINGMPAVVSTVLGGNATLAWESTPGVVVYVGYSGAPLDDRAIAAADGHRKFLVGNSLTSDSRQSH